VRRPNCARRLSSALVLLLAACGHSEAFSAPDNSSDTPFRPGEPTRLTYSLAGDGAVAWLPDASSLIYSFGKPESREGDHCLAQLPPTGGRITREICSPGAAAGDSVDTYGWPAVNSDGRIAYVRASRPPQSTSNRFEAIVVGTLAEPEAVSFRQGIPYNAVAGLHTSISQLRWLGADRLTWLGGAMTSYLPCPECAPARLRADRDVMVLDVATPASLRAVPGTETATSVAVGESDDIIYYTLAGDTRVYRRSISAGSSSVAHDFAPEIVRDVHVQSGRLAAVVGGLVEVVTDLQGQAVQLDQGGVLHVVDIGTGVDHRMEGPSILVRHPVLSPNGGALVTEASPFRINTVIFEGVVISVDTVIIGVANLWRFGQP
jgi:hypothetical protein